jgi:hypothetical protein
MNVLYTLLSIVGPMRPSPYLGPDTLLPLASILAAIAGFFLIFWRLILKFIKSMYRKIRGLPEEVPPDLDMDESVDDETEI